MLIKLMQRKIGLTLTELLVVVAIIGIISLALIPAITQRTENARVATARQEVKELAMAEDSCAITTGYYVPLQLLDNIKLSNEARDDSLNYETEVRYLIDPFYVYIKASGYNQPGTNQEIFNRSNYNHKIFTQWYGPYTSFVKTILKFVDVDPRPFSRRDYPLDPWDIPYRFFSPIGIIGNNANTTEKNLTNIFNNSGFSDGYVTLNLNDRYSGRWMIVSFGRNQEINYPTDVNNDDIVHAFGLVVHETNYFVRRF